MFEVRFFLLFHIPVLDSLYLLISLTQLRSLPRQPEETLKEDFLFPMSNRLSYASSPESDGDLKTHSLYDDHDASPTLARRPDASPTLARRPDASPTTPVRRPMVRSSSDPSIATLDNIPGIPPYQAPPSYLPDGRHVSVCGDVVYCI